MSIGEQKDRAPMPFRIWPGLVAATLLLSACGDSGDDVGDEDKLSIPVETIKPTRGDIDAMYSGTAPIEAFADALVIAKVGGEILDILVEEGDDVVKAEATLRKLERDYQRNVDLKEKALISTGDFEKIQFEMEALKAAYDLAQLEYSYTEIRAPIDGVVSQRFVKIGNTIDVNAETFQVTSLEPLVSYLHIPEREFRRIDPNQSASIEIDALQGASFDATVARVSPVVDPDTGTFKITIEVSDPTRRLKPGMFGRISIVYDQHLNVLQIPRSAIIEEAGSNSVFIVAGDIVEKREITTGFTEGGNIEVLDGISDDDEIVFVGHTNLKDGSNVTVIAPTVTKLSVTNDPSSDDVDN
jgi:membrane fusion protein (multidrug efflux system)